MSMDCPGPAHPCPPRSAWIGFAPSTRRVSATIARAISTTPAGHRSTTTPNSAEWRRRRHRLELTRVLQLDTDEVILDPHELLLAVVDADARGAVGVEYPSRYLYCRAEDGRFLEFVRPGWRVMANYPGPIAIRAGSRPRHARQIDGGLYRVDFAPNNTDPRHEFDATVHRVISPDQGIVHYYWVRSEEYLRRKMGWSGHADTYSEPRRLTAWRWHSRHPVLSAIRPASGPDREWFRLVRLSGDRTFWRGEL